MIKSDDDGLKIELKGPSTLVFSKKEPEGAPKITLDTELTSVMPHSIDLTELATELESFVGEWQACYSGTSAYMLTSPTFNSRGDVLFALRPIDTLVDPVSQKNGISG